MRVNEKLLKMSVKICCLAEFPPFLNSSIKSIIDMIYYLVLHRWWQFETNLITFWVVMAKKPPKASLKSYFLLLWKHLKFENSWTIDQTQMKLGPGMYHLNILHLPKHEFVNEWAGGGASEKPPNNAIKLTKSQLFNIT